MGKYGCENTSLYNIGQRRISRVENDKLLGKGWLQSAPLSILYCSKSVSLHVWLI